MNQPNDLITIKQAAEILTVKPRRIRQLAQAGKLDGYKPGRDWMVSRASVESYAAAHPAGRRASREQGQ